MSFDFNRSGIWQPKPRSNQISQLGSGSMEPTPGVIPAQQEGPDPLMQFGQQYAAGKATGMLDAALAKAMAPSAATTAAAPVTAATTAAPLAAALPAAASTTGVAAATAAPAASSAMAAAAPAMAAMGPAGWAALGVGALLGGKKLGLFNDGTTSVPSQPQAAPLATPMATPMVDPRMVQPAVQDTANYVNYNPEAFQPTNQGVDQAAMIRKALGGK
jgi:hypothetical protein